MQLINIHEAKTRFSKLVEAVSQGEEIIIAKAGKPTARLVPLQRQPFTRKPGTLKGKMKIAEDFDAPLPADIQLGFEGR
ncbi:prevent-host-death family protein [Candidatus Regiella insecticola 5.15]|uniref:Antitoxin n=1 Tax=Candidatus Regiella insecticola 5.15 TaxID=1005043 RepID=G2H0B6_9ENTR|nr:type II toxin-antitoxin system Phd/YefM family antitoxin [Candidatus Regiella insecticola]EGY28560.1 prevent-host-death family protein [Candidatus Regiella insecticola 5.15]